MLYYREILLKKKIHSVFEGCKFYVVITEIGDIAGVAEVTIRQSYKLMYPRAVSLFPVDYKFFTPIEQLPTQWKQIWQPIIDLPFRTVEQNNINTMFHAPRKCSTETYSGVMHCSSNTRWILFWNQDVQVDTGVKSDKYCFSSHTLLSMLHSSHSSPIRWPWCRMFYFYCNPYHL